MTFLDDIAEGWNSSFGQRVDDVKDLAGQASGWVGRTIADVAGVGGDQEKNDTFDYVLYGIAGLAGVGLLLVVLFRVL